MYVLSSFWVYIDVLTRLVTIHWDLLPFQWSTNHYPFITGSKFLTLVTLGGTQVILIYKDLLRVEENLTERSNHVNPLWYHTLVKSFHKLFRECHRNPFFLSLVCRHQAIETSTKLTEWGFKHLNTVVLSPIQKILNVG